MILPEIFSLQEQLSQDDWCLVWNFAKDIEPPVLFLSYLLPIVKRAENWGANSYSRCSSSDRGILRECRYTSSV